MTINIEPRQSRWNLLLIGLAIIAAIILTYRFVYGLGAVTHLSNQFPWGLWVVLDVIIGSSIACGGFAVSVMIIVLNKGGYHPLLRPALLTSLFGYSLAGISAVFDMGRYWQVTNLYNVNYQNWNSVMLEVALCISAYCLILLLELSPPWLRRWGLNQVERLVNQLMFILLIVGLLLASLHQASLGSLLVLLDQRVMPLWQSAELIPVLTLLTALMTGGAIVVLESGRHQHASNFPMIILRQQLATWAALLGLAFVAIRLIELSWTNKLILLSNEPGYASLLLLELLLFAAPAVILKRQSTGHGLMIAVTCLIIANCLYRFNAFLFAFSPALEQRYQPSLAEWLVSAGIIALELLLFRQLVGGFSTPDKNKTAPLTH